MTVPDGDRLDNGLHAVTYVPLTDVEPEVGRHLLDALGRARIAAYLNPAPDSMRRRLFVDSDDRVDARTIVAAAVRGMGNDPGGPQPTPVSDPLAGLDTDVAFRALVAGWHVDTTAAVRDAERDLTREDADWRLRLNPPPAPADENRQDWLDDDHYVPPPPPPLPRLSGPTVIAIVVLVLSVLLLAIGATMGLPGDFSFTLGIGGLVLGAAILFTRVREFHRDEDDDGSAI